MRRKTKKPEPAPEAFNIVPVESAKGVSDAEALAVPCPRCKVKKNACCVRVCIDIGTPTGIHEARRLAAKHRPRRWDSKIEDDLAFKGGE